MIVTRDQAFQLGQALMAWSRGMTLEARDTLNANKNWHPFFPDSYEKISVEDGIEWRTVKPASCPLISDGSAIEAK